MENKKEIKILTEEVWYGGIVDEGLRFPLTAQDSWQADLTINNTTNQITTVFMSNQGRVIGSENGFKITFEHGTINITKSKTNINLVTSNEKTLQGAYRLAMETYFPFTNKNIPIEMYQNAQFNTWIQLLYNQNEFDVIQYARDILDNGYEPGVLMIDDGWSCYYGLWDFDKKKIPNPRKMIDDLHEMGFSVMLWVCPHITPDTMEFRELAKKNLLVRSQDGTIAIREWWNGYSAILDLSNPESSEWIKKSLNTLMNRYGIDGFKFDAGDARFYKDTDLTFGNVDANTQSHLWAELGSQFKFNELRAAVNNGGQRIVQRLADKDHSWEDKGIKGLIPNQMIQSLFGYPFSCPDMIGGGEYENFISNYEVLDQELFVRYAQISSLMPMMQFSAAPWKFLDKEHSFECLNAARLHLDFYNDLKVAFRKAEVTGEPITKPLEYVFPNQNLWKVTQQYMLGDTILIAPIYQKGCTEHTIILPKGIWQYIGGEKYKGGRDIKIVAGINTLPIFKLIET